MLFGDRIIVDGMIVHLGKYMSGVGDQSKMGTILKLIWIFSIIYTL